MSRRLEGPLERAERLDRRTFVVGLGTVVVAAVVILAAARFVLDRVWP